MKKPDKKKILKALKILFGVLVVVFLAWYFWKNWDEFSDKIMNVDMGIFIFSMLFYFLYKITLASLWHYITKLNGCAIKYEKAVTSYLYSILGKYIPGKVFMLAARLTYYKEEDAPLSKVTVCFFIENVCTLLGAAMLFIVSLLFFPNELLENYKWVTIALIVVFFVCIHPKIINFFLRILGKLFKKDLEIPMKYSQMLKVVLLFIGNWLIVGVGFFILTKSIYPAVEYSELLFCAGIWGVSAIMGILAIFAPSGLGVREGIIVAGLCLIMPQSDAMVVSVVSRLWQTIPELVLVALAFIWSRIRNMSKIKLKKGAEGATEPELPLCAGYADDFTRAKPEQHLGLGEYPGFFLVGQLILDDDAWALQEQVVALCAVEAVLAVYPGDSRYILRLHVCDCYLRTAAEPVQQREPHSAFPAVAQYGAAFSFKKGA